MKEIRQQFLTGERALFQGADLKIYDTIFDDGESPLKESHNIELRNSMFKWKYPLWYSDSISVKDCTGLTWRVPVCGIRTIWLLKIVRLRHLKISADARI